MRRSVAEGRLCAVERRRHAAWRNVALLRHLLRLEPEPVRLRFQLMRLTRRLAIQSRVILLGRFLRVSGALKAAIGLTVVEISTEMSGACPKGHAIE
jgi:hypothetical protein